jgi:hypothetical protein
MGTEWGTQPMQCRNCRCYLDDDFRYCPRCGTPNTLAWPVSRAPWVRRPAAVVGVALLLIGWLAALQRQLWLPRGGLGASSRPPMRLAARLPEPEWPPRQRTSQVRYSPVARARSAPNGSQANSAVRRQAPPTRGERKRKPVFPSPATRSQVSRPGLRVASRRESLRQESRSGKHGVTRDRKLLLATLPELPERVSRPRDFARPWALSPRRPRREPRLSRFRPIGQRRGNDPWARPPVFVCTPGSRSPRPTLTASNLTVSISAKPYGVKTFVYMDGGRELGIAPLRVRFDRPGRHRLFFFAPTLGRAGRVHRVIQVTGRSRQWVAATMSPTREVADLINM